MPRPDDSGNMSIHTAKHLEKNKCMAFCAGARLQKLNREVDMSAFERRLRQHSSQLFTDSDVEPVLIVDYNNRAACLPTRRAVPSRCHFPQILKINSLQRRERLRHGRGAIANGLGGAELRNISVGGERNCAG